MGKLNPYCIMITIALLVFTHKCSIEASSQPSDTIKKCIAHERSALLTFRAGLSDPANRLSSWEGDNCCQWKGVGCSNVTGHIVKLDLQGPDCDNSVVSMQVLGGNISSSLIDLQQLEYLDLSCNRFTMVKIPEFLSSLHGLTYLDLSQSSLVGRIPPQLGNLSNLRFLSLDSIFGDTHSKDITWLSRLSSLEHLDMSWVNLSTITNWVSVVNKLPSLVSLDLSFCALSTSPDSLLDSNLTSLDSLSIEGNYFHIGMAPNWFWDLTNLKHLDASGCQFHGPFPYEIGNMTSLVSLDLSMNDLVGMIPSNLDNLCNLERFVSFGNNIDGSITELLQRLPNCSWDKLKDLFLPLSNLTGNLPAILEPFRNLKRLELSDNKLTGLVPLWVGQLTNLVYLDLSSNSFEGVIHEEHLSSLVNLKRLSLSGNSIAITVNSTWVPPFNLSFIELSSCGLGPKFPAWLRSQTDAFLLDISNNAISDILPDWFWVVASSVFYLNMRNNQIRGVLPHGMEFMRIRELDLRSNQFSGPIPKLPANITNLDVGRNNISGPLPVDFGGLGLEALILFDNSISGTIPSSLCKLPSLLLLDLSGNELSGSCPDCLVNASTTNMTALDLVNLSLRNNHLSGEFPSFLQYCPKLTFLDLANNQFSGTLPLWIGKKLEHLEFLRLRHNFFNGDVSVVLTNLVNLRYLDLAYNNLSGIIPTSIVNYMGMTPKGDSDGEFGGPVIPISGFAYGGTIPYIENITVVTKGQERLYTGEIIYMVNLDLSSNNLCGDIPEEIGTLVSLTNLNLSRNVFTGKIPEKIGALVQVESLDLSHNRLSGEIPTSLSALTSLSHLNLSYNNLTGKIPSGKQLEVLDDQASIYIGNPGLCGPPLSKKCPETAGLIHAAPEEHNDARNNALMFISTSFGFLMGLSTIFCILLFKTKWRIVCFALSDLLCDWVYVQVAVVWSTLRRKMGTT